MLLSLWKVHSRQQAIKERRVAPQPVKVMSKSHQTSPGPVSVNRELKYRTNKSTPASPKTQPVLEAAEEERGQPQLRKGDSSAAYGSEHSQQRTSSRSGSVSHRRGTSAEQQRLSQDND